jgi:hypothetical protein
VTVTDERTNLTVFVDLNGRTRGSWDVVVTTPGGIKTTLERAFTVKGGQSPRIWVDVVGRSTIRPCREQTFNVFYGNAGNIDARGVPLWIAGIPKNAVWKLADAKRMEF